MIWESDQVLVTWGYTPRTRPALEWQQDSAGYWSASDRGAAQDVLESSVLFRGPEAELIDLEAVLGGYRNAFNITCGTGEEIFGADVDYSSPLSVTVIDYGAIERVSFGQYSMPLRLRLLAPTFQVLTGSLAALRLSAWRYGAFASFDINKNFTYTGAAHYADHGADVGEFRGEFTQTPAEMAVIRRYLLTTARGNAIAFPALGGITYPFGNRKGAYGTLNCHVREWEDLGRENLGDWKLRLTLSEAP